VADLKRLDKVPMGEGVFPANMKFDPHFQVAVLVLGLMPAWVLHGGDIGAVKPDSGAAKSSASALSPAAPSVEVPELKLPSNVELPDAVKGLAADFRTQTQNYMDRQRALWKRAEGMSKTEREQLKEQLKANRSEFLQQTRQLRAELKERIKELQKSLSNSRPLDDVGGERGGRGRRGK
jgi:hypothetical protein